MLCSWFACNWEYWSWGVRCENSQGFNLSSEELHVATLQEWYLGDALNLLWLVDKVDEKGPYYLLLLWKCIKYSIWYDFHMIEHSDVTAGEHNRKNKR